MFSANERAKFTKSNRKLYPSGVNKMNLYVSDRRFEKRRVGPAADKLRRPTVRRLHHGGPAFALLACPTLRFRNSKSSQEILDGVAALGAARHQSSGMTRFSKAQEYDSVAARKVLPLITRCYRVLPTHVHTDANAVWALEGPFLQNCRVAESPRCRIATTAKTVVYKT